MNAAELSVFAGAIEQLCSEMDSTLERTAFSPIISESADRACGMYGTDGAVIAQGRRGLPIFVGIMQFSVEAFLREVDGYTDGEIYIMNDPYRGGTHLMDTRIVAPFYYQGELVCFLANTAHWADIGGATPGRIRHPLRRPSMQRVSAFRLRAWSPTASSTATSSTSSWRTSASRRTAKGTCWPS